MTNATCKILVVDDDADYPRFVEGAFSGTPYATIIAQSPGQGLELAQQFYAKGELYAVLTDLDMKIGEMQARPRDEQRNAGFTFITTLRDQKIEVPIFLYSAVAGAFTVKEEAKKLGVISFDKAMGDFYAIARTMQEESTKFWQNQGGRICE